MILDWNIIKSRTEKLTKMWNLQSQIQRKSSLAKMWDNELEKLIESSGGERKKNGIQLEKLHIQRGIQNFRFRSDQLEAFRQLLPSRSS